MKVLFLAPPPVEADRLTAHSFLDEEIEGLAGAGHEVYIPTLRNDTPQDYPRIHPLDIGSGTSGDRIRGFLLSVRQLAPWAVASERIFSARLEMTLARVAAPYQIGLVHSHFGSLGGWGGALLADRLHLPLVATLRGMDLLTDPTIGYGLRQDTSYEAALRRAISRAQVTTYASKFMRDVGIRFGADPKHAVTIYKGVDLKRFRPAEDRERMKREMGVEGGLVLTVGGLHPRKGIDQALRALARLPSDQPLTYVVCGDGAERDRLKSLACTLGLSDRLRLPGNVSRDEIPRYFAACDLFVLTSRVEAAGNVVLEAMAAARPVVCTDSGGPPEYVQHGCTGYIVPVGDAETTARRINELLADPALADRMGASGRKRVEERHAYSRLIEGFQGSYQLAVDRFQGNGKP